MIPRPSKSGFLVLCSGALMACALDSRVLNEAGTDSPCQATNDCAARGGGSTGGISNGAAGGGRGEAINTSGGGSAASGAPSSAGEGGQMQEQVGPTMDCPDLDQNTVLDCTETRVTNPGFDVDVKGWSPEASGAISWESLDATGSNTSGSIRVENRGAATGPDNGLTYTGATQCVKVEPNRAYIIFAQMYARGPMVEAFASVVGRSFASEDCSGTPLQVQTSAIQGTVNLWLTLQVTVPAVMSSGSMLVELSVGKPRSVTGNATLNFDNVLVR